MENCFCQVNIITKQITNDQLHTLKEFNYMNWFTFKLCCKNKVLEQNNKLRISQFSLCKLFM